MHQTSLTLISHPLCPFVQRAAIILLEKGVQFEKIDVNLSAKPDWFLALSPTGKVPLLKIAQTDGSAAVVFESMVICEYLEETAGGAAMYPTDAVSRAQHRGWIEFITAALADAWQFLNAKDRPTAEAKQAAFRDRLRRLEEAITPSPYFGGTRFGMVDAVAAPLFRYFDIINSDISQPIFEGLPRITAWRTALAAHESVRNAVPDDYAHRFLEHLRNQNALLAA